MTTNDIPRRIRIDQWTPAERAIQSAVDAVEAAGADVRLTDAVVLLGKAREAVADFVDGVERRPAQDTRAFVCGGRLNDAAALELEDFARHLTTHPRGAIVSGCRFCVQRAAPRA